MRRHLDIEPGRRLSYLDAGHGRVVVLLHAFPLDAEMWLPQFDALPNGWRLIAPDLPGFGQSTSVPSDGTQDAALEPFAGDVVKLLDALGIQTAVIGGLSMGGYVTLALVRRAIARCSALVLADTRPQADTDAGRLGRVKMQELAGREGPSGVAREMLPKLLSAQARPDVIARVRELIERTSTLAITDALGRMMRRPDSTDLLPSISVPTLVLVGQEDGLTPPSDADMMHRAVPGSVLEVIPGAGHISNLEQPESFNAALRRFLAGLG